MELGQGDRYLEAGDSRSGVYGSDDPDRFVANYRGKLSHLVFYLMLFAVPFGAFWALQFDENVRSWLFEEFPELAPEALAGPIILLAIFSALIALDVILVLLALMSGKPALVIDDYGVRGFTGGFWRQFPWEEVDYVYLKSGLFSIARKPRGPLTKLFYRFSKVGDRTRGRWEFAIHAPIKRLDKSRADIYAAIARRRPDLLENEADPYAI